MPSAFCSRNDFWNFAKCRGENLWLLHALQYVGKLAFPEKMKSCIIW